MDGWKTENICHDENKGSMLQGDAELLIKREKI